MSSSDPTLAAEQAYLSRARDHLGAMRDRTLGLTVQAGDATSAEYLAATLHRRAVSLVDDPGTTLFFGRTDHDDGSTWYIGRRHVADDQGDPVVIDWRAEVSRAFYRAGVRRPMGVTRRRRFGVEQGQLTAYEDEVLDPHRADGSEPADPSASTQPSGILAHEIERPRVGPMRDIVATIQPEQDEIVRADVDVSVCVQGAPGTGKTAVGLHRAAWLLYAHRARLSRTGVLVVGPNAAFLDHVAAVLPSLGEVQVGHTTVEDLVGGHSKRSGPPDPVPVATLKGDPRMAGLLRRAVWNHLRPVTEPLVLPRGVRRWRVPAHTVREIVEELSTRGARYHAARAMLARRLAHALLVQFEDAGDSPDDRVQDTVARSREVRRTVDDVWPALTPAKVLWGVLSDAEALARAAEGILDADEQARLLWARPPRSAGTVRWSASDDALLDEIGDLLERTPSLGHVVLDEAQDLSPMQLRAVGRRCSTGSATVLGDIAQGTTPWATPSWADSLDHLGKPQAQLEELTRGFRVPSAVIDWAARLLPAMAAGLQPPRSVRSDPGSLVLTRVEGQTARWPAVVDAVDSALREEGSVGLIVPDAWAGDAASALRSVGVDHAVLAGRASSMASEDLVDDAAADTRPATWTPPRVSVVPATVAKGLEYDRVVVVEPTRMAADEPDLRTGLRRLYVVLTRAVSGLTVVHVDDLPELLR